MKDKILQLIVIVCCLAAMIVCSNLLNKHISGEKGPAWFAAGCSDEAKEGEADCEAVLASPYSYYPPKMSDEPDGKAHMPVAFFGLVYYSVLLVWFIGIGRPSMPQRRLHWIPLLVVGMGLASSIHFVRIMYSVINEWCPWCMVTHGLNFIIAVCIIWMWPRLKKGQPAEKVVVEQQVAPRQQDAILAASHPSGRLLIMTLVAIFITMFGELNLLGLKSWRKQSETIKTNYDQCVNVVEQFKKESEVLIRKWQKAPNQNIPIRDDDPILHNPKDNRPSLTMVVFSDFECPSCGKFAKFAREKILPMFDGQMRMVFKHYPIDRSCNPKVARTMHPHACTAAYMAEAARVVGGNGAFWKAHDLLFANRHALKQGKITPDLLAPKIGVNADNLKAAIKEAVNDAKKSTLQDAKNDNKNSTQDDTLATSSGGGMATDGSMAAGGSKTAAESRVTGGSKATSGSKATGGKLSDEPDKVASGSQAVDGILSRIHEDIDLAKACEIHGTPAVFLEGKKVDSLAVTEITFWNTIAASFWKNAKLPRPQSTKTDTGNAGNQ